MTTRTSRPISMPPRISDPPSIEVTHPLSNDIVPVDDLAPTADTVPEPEAASPTFASKDADAPALTPVERKVGRTTLWFLLAAGIIGLILAVVLFPRPELFLIGGVLAVAFAFMLMAPVILAETTRVAQDETVKEDLAGHDEPNAGASRH